LPLSITIPGQEYYDEVNNEFKSIGDTNVTLEHSLISISKWEAKWHKSYLSTPDKTPEEIMDYIRCMTITPHVDPSVFDFLTQSNINEIVNYINDPMTATTFSDDKTDSTSKNIVTSELIYYWMIACQIPVAFEKWHINRLMTLIKVCEIKNNPDKKKMSKSQLYNRQRAINEANRKKFSSKG